jgi:S-adenosylmethionine hydrolase
VIPVSTPSGILTLTTDFGHEGPFVATMKGRILSRFPAARIIDLTHEIPVYWPAEAGFWLERSYAYFPAGTVHVAVVDPGVGTRRDIIVVECDGHVFLAPDNGLLAPLVTRATAAGRSARVFRLDATRLGRFALGTASATFHGRDIFAPLAAELAAGRCIPGDIGVPVADIIPSWVDDPVDHGRQVTGVVMAIDHFGNLITNIDGARAGQFRAPIVRTGNHEFPLRRTYGDAKPGDYLALVNSFNVVEIARAEQSAAEGLGVGRGAPVSVVETISTR